MDSPLRDMKNVSKEKGMLEQVKPAQNALKRFLEHQDVVPENYEQIQIWLTDFAEYFDSGSHLHDCTHCNQHK